MLRRGCQEPTFERLGTWSSSRGKDAIEMFEAYGRRYYGSQKHEMEVFFARDENGGFAAKSIGITKPRQNGKSFAARDYCIWQAAVEGNSVLYSAHHGRTVRKMFKEMCDFIDAHEDFKAELEYIYKAGGYEGIYFKNGACIEFQTRTASGGRGGTYRILVLDEAQELTNAQMEAIIPTVSAAAELEDGAGEPQKIYIGTVPGPECSGTVFRDMHDRAHEGTTSVWWLEWGVQANGLDDVALDDVDNWYLANPAMGRRMSEATVRDELDTMSPDGFARERLGWWPPVALVVETGCIDADSWDALSIAKNEVPNEGAPSFAMKFSDDGLVGCIAACRKHADGRYHTEVITERTLECGINWFVEFAIRREDTAGGIVIDGGGTADIVYKNLINQGMPKQMVIMSGTHDFTMACSLFVDSVLMGNMTHISQPGLDESAKNVRRRRIGKAGYGFEGINGADALPAETAALALWACEYIDWEPDDDLQIG